MQTLDRNGSKIRVHTVPQKIIVAKIDENYINNNYGKNVRQKVCATFFKTGACFCAQHIFFLFRI